ncbi:MAG: response regulator [Proteobacteria bacterium]|nr:response regulator [Pseudomonadota bacterium]
MLPVKHYAYWLIPLYALSGWLGLALAIPPGYATAIFPPAGIALAACLLLGRKALGPIWLGAFLLNNFLAWNNGHWSVSSLQLAAMIASASSLQALAGMVLVRRGFVEPLQLDEPSHLLKVFLLGGLACCVAATLAIASLSYMGIVQPADLAYTAFTWWVGDTLGVVIFAPLVLIWFNPAYNRKSMLKSILLPMVIVLTLLIALFFQVSSWQNQRIRAQFIERAARESEQLRERLNNYHVILQATARFIVSSPKMTPEQFSRFSSSFIESEPALQRLEWVPILSRDQLSAFTREQGVYHTDFTIFETNRAGQRAPLSPRKSYAPVSYIEPLLGQEDQIGFDLMSVPESASLLKQAAERGEMTASARLPQIINKSNRIFLVQPVYAIDAKRDKQERKPPSSFIIAEMAIDKLLRKPEGRTSLCLFDEHKGQSQQLDFQPHCTGILQHEVHYPIGGRQWRMVFAANNDYLIAQRNWAAWMMLVGGLLIVALFEVFLLTMVGRKSRIEALVAQRTTELALATAAAEAAALAKGQFLATMSHEIRTPMNAIIGLSWLVQQTELSEIQRDYLRHIEGAGQSLLGVINDILDYSKIEAGKLTLERATFDLAYVLDGLGCVAGMAACNKPIKLWFTLAPNVPRELIGDSLRLSQILINLCNNAIKFTETGSVQLSISVASLETNSCSLQFAVRDSGVGMSEEQVGKLFQSFSQGDTSTTRKYGGSGLGLAISQRLVNMMGGQITATSTLGKGSCFSFTVPLDLHTDEMLSWHCVPPLLQNLSVLMLDEQEGELGDQSGIQTMLKDLGWQVQCSTNLEALPSLLAKGQIDVILLGVDMTQAHVEYTLAQIKPLANRPIVLRTSNYGYLQRDQAELEAGVSSVLHQPILPTHILDAVLTLLVKKNEGIAPVAEPELLPLKGMHLLVVDDSPLNLRVAKGILLKHGADVDTVESGEAALVKLAEKPAYAAILMDVQMPGMDGYMTTQVLRKQYSSEQLPIIAMTANVQEEDRQLAFASGMNDFLAKPVQVSAILAALLKVKNKTK